MMIYDWARGRAELNPGRSAITLHQETLTYGELETQSNQLAGALLKSGFKPGSRVALLLEKTPDAIAAMHGISKAGGIYVPIDIHSPADRVAKILRSSDVSLLMVDRHARSLYTRLIKTDAVFSKIPRVWWSRTESPGSDRLLFQQKDISAEPNIAHAIRRDEDSTAHILFTSGSTGMPKGVEITHRNIRTFIEWAVHYFKMNADDRVSCHSPLHFDLSTFDIYGAFAAGAQVFVVPPSMSVLPQKLCDFILRNRLTQWFSVPSALSYLARFKAIPAGGFPDLKRLIWCGEVFPVQSLRYWMQELPDVQFTNLYGPTEATIASSYHTLEEIPDEGTEVPIGEACSGEQLWVLDEEMNLTPKGGKGDLYISGVGLSPGYWRDAAKTNMAFRAWKNPTGRIIRVYKTGDIASTGEDGLFYCHGRADYQIKSRGYRIELGEIEHALDELQLFREFAVVPVETDSFEGKAIGCAYVPVNDPTGPVQIKKLLAGKIPNYMIPQHWDAFSILPRNGNGKIDRKSLSGHFEQVSGNKNISSKTA